MPPELAKLTKLAKLPKPPKLAKVAEVAEVTQVEWREREIRGNWPPLVGRGDQQASPERKQV